MFKFAGLSQHTAHHQWTNKLFGPYLRSSSSVSGGDNPESEASLYSYPVLNYFGDKNVSQEFIVKDIRAYVRKWQNRSYQIAGDVQVHKSDGKLFDVEVPFSWSVSTARSNYLAHLFFMRHWSTVVSGPLIASIYEKPLK
jgi:hypothetical protein